MIRADWRTLAPSLSEALAAGIRDAVLDGQIRSTDRLPAERQLATQLGVSRGTVAAAFARLRAEGWLSTRHGSGSTVRIPAALRLRYAPLSVDHAGRSWICGKRCPPLPTTHTWPRSATQRPGHPACCSGTASPDPACLSCAT